ncbi:hypothetical protein [Alkalihalobacterium bogoriense]|uniref:hypothetical protein n=3 Tax=Bacteria TaxID=2 RepID=UPI0006880128|nr:hypothetical protein [Alkalihalobacterium bogoriense]
MTGLEKKKELYNLRNGYLKYNPYFQYTEINVYKFFELIYSRNDEMPLEECEGASQEHQNHKYHGIATEILKDRARHFMIFNDLNFLEEIKDREFVITSPISYIGRNRTAKNSRFLYAFAIDLDGVEKQHIENIFYQYKSGAMPKPNIIVSSGNGLHLYYILEKPIALFDNIKILLKRFKYGLIDLVWNGYTSSVKKRQYQGIFQGFRIPETKTKFGEIVRAFYLENSELYTVERLNHWVTGRRKLVDTEIDIINKALYIPKKLTLKEAKEKYPDWYERRIVKGDKSRKKWHIKRDLYDWWKRTITDNEKVVEGHRYFCIMSLAMYGLKCDIPYEEVKADAYSFLEEMESKTGNQDNHFTEEDIEDALKAYKESYMTFPRKDIEVVTGISIPPNKRNYQKQKDHLEEIRMIRDLRMKRQGKKWTDNNGRKSKKDEVISYLLFNQNATKYKCIKETGLSKPTVYKYWEEAHQFLETLKPKFYKNFSEIPFARKNRLFREMSWRYKFDENMSEEDKKIMRKIDYIHELLKLVNIHNYEWAKNIYKKREKDKKVIKLKNLIIRQSKKSKNIGNLSEFNKLIKEAETEEKINEICLKYDFLPNLELF